MINRDWASFVWSEIFYFEFLFLSGADWYFPIISLHACSLFFIILTSFFLCYRRFFASELMSARNSWIMFLRPENCWRTARLDGGAYEQLYQQLMLNVIQFRAHFLFFSHCIIFLGYEMGKIRAHTREKSLKTYRKEIQQVCVEKLSLELWSYCEMSLNTPELVPTHRIWMKLHMTLHTKKNQYENDNWDF